MRDHYEDRTVDIEETIQFRFDGNIEIDENGDIEVLCETDKDWTCFECPDNKYGDWTYEHEIYATSEDVFDAWADLVSDNLMNRPDFIPGVYHVAGNATFEVTIYDVQQTIFVYQDEDGFGDYDIEDEYPEGCDHEFTDTQVDLDTIELIEAN